ncbi:hypothetical protein G6L37_11825 [Agrobacterium rubi]|uniref:hypothetical protein n=1 Tax=Agrobacterium rubi TaxID=28099 RepID=UPI00157397C5|nr:hypothetical protein [Agrobacterium rubi]NTF06850.1 hypothetical protein [Agrobacterium rubi]NTF19092.1 hypothetical protein [Agrobacterium rubi]NTF26055.1 hypothetical protein [Agrobacterium rubi]
MNEYGVWLKGETSEKLMFTGTMNDAYRFSAVEQEKDETLKDRWRIGILPQFIVTLETSQGQRTVGAFASKEQAILFAKEYLEEHDGKIEANAVNIRY